MKNLLLYLLDDVLLINSSKSSLLPLLFKLFQNRGEKKVFSQFAIIKEVIAFSSFKSIKLSNSSTSFIDFFSYGKTAIIAIVDVLSGKR